MSAYDIYFTVRTTNGVSMGWMVQRSSPTKHKISGIDPEFFFWEEQHRPRFCPVYLGWANFVDSVRFWVGLELNILTRPSLSLYTLFFSKTT